MAVNLRAAYFLSAYAARALMGRDRPGSIIHISRQMGHVGGVDRAVGVVVAGDADLDERYVVDRRPEVDQLARVERVGGAEELEQ